ncbi:MAG TPA: hypothetical protein VGN35_11105 [Jatrophihabitantaceae bacterium]|jgi:hypothetical protein|nr:hypothetical protein [Jatrophihabitantaceae bacterium]
MTTVLVEPDPNGHRFQAVADVAAVAARDGDVVLLTSVGATATDWFASALGDVPIEAVERFDGIYPPTREIADAVAELCRSRNVSTVVVMDADESLKRWWFAAALAFRGLPKRPRVVFMLTRYIARLELTDWRGWYLRITKATLVLLAMATRTLHRTGGFAGRDDRSEGLVVKRLRDPAGCSAHARDRLELRRALGLPPDRRIVGIIGLIDARKSVPLVYSAALASAPNADLLVAGVVQNDVGEWLDSQPEGALDRMILRRRHLTNDELDQLVAACDVISVVQLNKGPSGIMGKALAAGVPVVTAGSKVRARELSVTRAGIAADMSSASIADALRGLYGKDLTALGAEVVPATREAFAETLLGVSPIR